MNHVQMLIFYDVTIQTAKYGVDWRQLDLIFKSKLATGVCNQKNEIVPSHENSSLSKTRFLLNQNLNLGESLSVFKSTLFFLENLFLLIGEENLIIINANIFIKVRCVESLENLNHAANAYGKFRGKIFRD